MHGEDIEALHEMLWSTTHPPTPRQSVALTHAIARLRKSDGAEREALERARTAGRTEGYEAAADEVRDCNAHAEAYKADAARLESALERLRMLADIYLIETIPTRSTRADIVARNLRAELEAWPSSCERTVRSEVMQFAELMELALRDNDHKPGWRDDTARDLLRRASEELEELRDAIGRRGVAPSTPSQIAREAADVANFCMMIADVTGGLRNAIATFTGERRVQP